MKWTVTYRPSAKDELATLWLNASDRQAVADAADTIDRRLRNDPFADSESRGGKLRILIETPLAVLYRVDEGDLSASIVHVFEWR